MEVYMNVFLFPLLLYFHSDAFCHEFYLDCYVYI